MSNGERRTELRDHPTVRHSVARPQNAASDLRPDLLVTQPDPKPVSIVKPGYWVGTSNVDWTEAERKLHSFSSGLPLWPLGLAPSMVLGWRQFIANLALMCSMEFMIIAFRMARPPRLLIDQEDATGPDEETVDLVFHSRTERVGSDHGVLWSEAGRLYFAGRCTSFVLSRDDINWNAFQESGPLTEAGVIIPLVSGGRIETPNGHLRRRIQRLSTLRDTPDLSTEDRQLPPMVRPPSLPKTTLKWNDRRMWRLALPYKLEEFPLGGVILATVSSWASISLSLVIYRVLFHRWDWFFSLLIGMPIAASVAMIKAWKQHRP